LLQNIVRQQMAMVRAHWDLVVRAILSLAADFFSRQSTDNTSHVRTAAEVFRFMERSVGLTHYLPEMREMNPWCEFLHHRQQIVVGARPIGANTKGQSIRRRIDTCEYRAYIFSRGNDARQTEQRPWRIIRVDCERMPNSSATGTTSRKNAIRWARSSSADMPLYSDSKFKSVVRV
jgi:hypothetical protein